MLMTKIRTFNNEMVATVGGTPTQCRLNARSEMYISLDQVGLGSVQFYTRLLVNLVYLVILYASYYIMNTYTIYSK